MIHSNQSGVGGEREGEGGRNVKLVRTSKWSTSDAVEDGLDFQEDFMGTRTIFLSLELPWEKFRNCFSCYSKLKLVFRVPFCDPSVMTGNSSDPLEWPAGVDMWILPPILVAPRTLSGKAQMCVTSLP
jgi:hypothetical protein